MNAGEPPGTEPRPVSAAAPSEAPGRSGGFFPALRPAAVAGLLTVHVALVLDCAARDFATYDEMGNLAAGLSYWETGNYRLYNVNPPLPKLLASLPVWLSGPDLSALRQPGESGHRPEWEVGDQFARHNAARCRTLIFLARCPGAVWAVLAALLVYRWASVLWGSRGGLVALTAWCCEPNVIAHAHVLGSDLAGTATGLLAAYRFRSYLSAPAWGEAAQAGACLGLALACKFTLIVLCPLWVALWLALVGARRPAGGGALKRLAVAAQFALLATTCCLVVNLVYAFSGSFRPLGEYPFVSETFAGPPGAWPRETSGNRFAGTWIGRVPVPLPDDFLRGIDVQRNDFEEHRTRPNYLAGEWKQGGWWYYYLYAAAVKVPLGLWLLFLASLLVPLLAPGPPQAGWTELALLLLPGLAIFATVSTQTSLQNHFRYALPAMPYWIIFLGRAGTLFTAAVRWLRPVPAVALAWAVASCLGHHPHSLSYFNEVAGGPDHGHDHLLGSNIDWGQDLVRLKRWADDHPDARPLKVAYFNHLDPRVIDLDFTPPPLGVVGGPPADHAGALAAGPQPGYYAVSVCLVRGSQAALPDGRGGYRYVPPHGLSYFHRFRPIAKAGYSIFIYRIPLAEANAVRAEYGLPPLPPDWGQNPREK